MKTESRTALSITAPIALALVGACFDGPALEATNARLGAGDGGVVGAEGGAGATSTSSGSSGAGTPSGLPCDVDALLASRCRACHARPPINGAPMSLVTYEDLVAPGKSDASKKVAALCLARIQNDAAPMPPSGPRATAAEVAALSSWVSGGEPRGTCGASGDDGGTTTSSSSSGGPPEPTVCTSGTFWTLGDKGSPAMHPGGACLACHAQNPPEAPHFTIGGTVFPTFHEPIDCNGVASGALVVITDANGQTIQLQTNDAGNFFWDKPIATPYRAKVVYGGRERAMPIAQTSGDCNSCHTEGGTNGAPGRVARP